MNEAKHPTPETLEAFAASELAAGDRAVVDSHLVACDSCSAAIEEWRTLFTALAGLPTFSPSAAFSDRVMAGVRVPVPWPVRARGWARQAGGALERVLPGTTRGWAIASAFLALPVLVIGGLLFWLLSRSYVTAQDLWIFTTERFGQLVATSGAWVFHRVIESDAAVWLVRTLDALVEAGGTSGIGLIGALLGIGMAVSIWVLYTNLFRTPTRDANYVTYSF
jgi:anti-sigma factor RsiW